MREIVNVECKRILNRKLLGVILIISLVFSIFCVISNFNTYNIYDSSGKVIISSKENLAESKKGKHNVTLDKQTLVKLVNNEDINNYLYNITPLRLLLATYQDKNVSDLTENDLERFYEQRIDTLEYSAIRSIGNFTDEQIGYLKTKVSQMEKPLQIGYSEGWKNLNNDLSNIIVFILLIVSVILLPIFGRMSKFNMDQICNSTKFGKLVFIKVKMLTGLKVTSIVYFMVVAILTISELTFFGANGYNLVIQSDPLYFTSSLNITFLELYLINVFIGYVATIFMAIVPIFLTALTGQIITGGLLTTFFWIIMLSIPSNLFTSYRITHSLSNFFPYNMTNFNRLCRNNEVYEVFGVMIPSWIWIVIVVLIIFAIVALGTYVVASFKLSRKYLLRER